MRDSDLVDEAFLQAKYGVASGAAYADMALLRGDTSDGLPGVAGFGEKTAAKLIATYGDLGVAALGGGRRRPGLKGAQRARLEAASAYLDAAPVVVAVARDAPVPDVDLRLPTDVADVRLLSEVASTWGRGELRRTGVLTRAADPRRGLRAPRIRTAAGTGTSTSPRQPGLLPDRDVDVTPTTGLLPDRCVPFSQPSGGSGGCRGGRPRSRWPWRTATPAGRGAGRARRRRRGDVDERVRRALTSTRTRSCQQLDAVDGAAPDVAGARRAGSAVASTTADGLTAASTASPTCARASGSSVPVTRPPPSSSATPPAASRPDHRVEPTSRATYCVAGRRATCRGVPS